MTKLKDCGIKDIEYIHDCILRFNELLKENASVVLKISAKSGKITGSGFEINNPNQSESNHKK
uniref:Uncharacterized protein n=1 Tax=viral metagenome TaxID=1070528 RepID=A0A6H1Z9S3_9ZZZZ